MNTEKCSLIDKSIEELEGSEKQMRFSRLLTICESVFGECRISGSHHFFKMPWQGDPRINLQKGKGDKAKPYQVRQVLQSLRKLRELECT